MKRLLRPLLILLICGVLGTRLAAQSGFGFTEGLSSWEAVAGEPRLGRVLVAVGDVNQDGSREFLTAWHSGSWQHDATIELRDGATGLPLLSTPGTGPFACDDLDGDGIEDFGYVDHSLPHPVIHLASAATFAPLMAWTFPIAAEELSSVLSCDDRDGDGIGDLLVASSDNITPRARFVSSVTGMVLDTFDRVCGTPHYPWAYSFAAYPLPDLDGDGVDDFAFASTTENWGGFDLSGAVFVRSGVDGTLIDVMGGWFSGQHFGQGVHPVGDLDGDGRTEIVVVSDDTQPPSTMPIRSPATRTELYRVHLPQWGPYRYPAVLPTEDVNGDGITDFLIGRSLLSGADGRLLIEVSSPAANPTSRFGRAVLPVESPGGGLEFLYGDSETNNSLSSRGRIDLIRVLAGIKASRKVLRVSNPQPIDLSLRFPDTEVGKSYRVLASLGPIGTHTVGTFTLPLAADPLLQRSSVMTPSWLPGGQGTVPATTYASATLVAPVTALFPVLGRTFRFAVVSYDASGPRWSSISVPVTVVP